MANKLTAKEIVDLNKEYTFFSWSNQGQVNPIPVTKAEAFIFGMRMANAILTSRRS